MRIKLSCLAALALMSAPVMAGDHDHGGGVFHAFRLETDAGVSSGDAVGTWDLDGWIGGDVDKLWIKSEGEIRAGEVEHAEVWALYSRNVATFWDAQVGLRQDIEPGGHTSLAVGITGLAPYFFEMEAHLLLRDDGDVGARFHVERELLFTNRLIVQPYAEANFWSEKDEAEGRGAGLVDAAFGVQTRYEIRRDIAPYLDLSAHRKFGWTADSARSKNEDVFEMAARFGIRWMF